VIINRSATRYAIIPQKILLILLYKTNTNEGEFGKNGRENITQKPGTKIPKERNRFEILATSASVKYYSGS
jgi:hypothetical protein